MVFQSPEGKIVVGRPYKYNEEIDDASILPEYESYIEEGSICTDLWWFSACDYDEFVKRSGGPPSKVGCVDEIVVELKQGPGRYRMTSKFLCQDREKAIEYSVIEKIDQ